MMSIKDKDFQVQKSWAICFNITMMTVIIFAKKEILKNVRSLFQKFNRSILGSKAISKKFPLSLLKSMIFIDYFKNFR